MFHTDTPGARWLLSVLAACAIAAPGLLATACSADRETARDKQESGAAPLESARGSNAGKESNGAQRRGQDMPADPNAVSADAARAVGIENAVASINPASGGNAEGVVTFTRGEHDDSMLVSVAVDGLEPGRHGFHIHAVGDCSADDASSAGGHFNPDDTRHGGPQAQEHHVGDMGNVEADEDGNVKTTLTFDDLTLSGPASILGRAVIFHAGADDLQSQPSGAAGARVGCGVIRAPAQAQTDVSATERAQGVGVR
ncbi:MAG: superoxide dismutase family protein [Halioglobus sp.]|nr:superoxide dismutase family protein [Halioglobus sp.]